MVSVVMQAVQIPLAIEEDGSKWISADELMRALRYVHGEICGGSDDLACGCPLFLALLEIECGLLALARVLEDPSDQQRLDDARVVLRG